MTDSLAHRAIAVPAADSAAGRQQSGNTPDATNLAPASATEQPKAAIRQLQRDITPAQTADSIGLAGTDSLAADTIYTSFPYAPFGTADSLQTAAAPSIWRDTTATALFGTQSTTVRPAHMDLGQPASLTNNAVFQSFVLLLAATYAILLYHNLGDVRTLLGRISRERATGERLSEDPGGSSFSRFLNITTTIGILFMGVAVVKYSDSLMLHQAGDILPHGAVMALSLMATLAYCLVVIYQVIAIRLAGAVTLSQPVITQLMLLKRIYFSLMVIITSPALLLFALCPHGTGEVWFFIVAIELAITLILYLKESLNLFLSKKISILHWFLYLCTVEVFPISLLWLLAVR